MNLHVWQLNLWQHQCAQTRAYSGHLGEEFHRTKTAARDSLRRRRKGDSTIHGDIFAVCIDESLYRAPPASEKEE